MADQEYHQHHHQEENAIEMTEQGNHEKNPSLTSPASISTTDKPLSSEEGGETTKNDRDDEWKEIVLLSGTKGLSSKQVDEQRLKYGWNESDEKPPSFILMIVKKFTGLTAILIEIAMVLSFVLGHTVDGIVIATLLLLNAVIALNEEHKAQIALNQLKEKLQLRARVQRDGEWQELNAKELVPGDRVRMRTGDMVSADFILTHGEIDCDQSSLTGESAIKSFSANIHYDNEKIAKEKTLVYAGSIVKRGEGTGIVVATGSSTYFGETARLVQSSKPNEHIQTILKKVVITLMSLVIVLVITTLIVIASRGNDLFRAIPLLLMTLITALPVALPAMFSVSLAIGSQELSKRSVLITRLNVVEDAAMMSILYSDKTGTLTKNELHVQDILPLNNRNKIKKNDNASDNNHDGQLNGDNKEENRYTINDVLMAAVLASKEENADPIDMAIINDYRTRFPQGAHVIDPSSPSPSVFPSYSRSDYELLHFIPFDASNRRTEAKLRYQRRLSIGGGMNDFSKNATIVNGAGTPRASIAAEEYRVIKGAVATLSAMAGIEDGSELSTIIHSHVSHHSSQGYRSLAVAIQSLNTNKNERRLSLNELIQQQNDQEKQTSSGSSSSPPIELIGLIAFYDPPRDDSAETIRSLREFGIQTKMLTGDAAPVAASIAKQIGLDGQIINLEHEKLLIAQEKNNNINNNSEETVVTIHNEHDNLSSTDAIEQIITRIDPLRDDISGFAQMFPHDKHYFVKAAQKKGILVAVTGDGVNDAPALKQAEVGTAVKNATDIAKGAASAVLLEDGLKPIVDLVKVGRSIHRRVAVWVINKVAKSTLHSLFILVMYLITGDFPISALMVVVLLLLMDFVLISIAFDHQSPSQHPEKWNLPQLTRVGLIVGLPGAGQMMAIIFMAKHYFDLAIDKQKTVAFECMFLWGMLALFAAREKSFFFSSRPSPILIAVVAIETIAVVIVAATGMEGVFDALGWSWSLSITAIALGCFVINDAIKAMFVRTFEKDL